MEPDQGPGLVQRGLGKGLQGFTQRRREESGGAEGQLSKAHAKQLLTYLRLLKQPVGLLLNFSEETMKQGIRRVVNDYNPD
jgi:hypothetical protein